MMTNVFNLVLGILAGGILYVRGEASMVEAITISLLYAIMFTVMDISREVRKD